MFTTKRFFRHRKCSILSIFDTASITKSRFTSKRNFKKFSAMFTNIYSISKIRITTINNFVNFIKDRISNQDIRVVNNKVIPIILKNLLNCKLRHKFSPKIFYHKNKKIKLKRKSNIVR